jgi:hypothetical protein
VQKFNEVRNRSGVKGAAITLNAADIKNFPALWFNFGINKSDRSHVLPPFQKTLMMKGHT